MAALYLAQAAPVPQLVRPLDRHSAARRFHVALGGRLTRRLNELAARKTYLQIGESMLVIRPGGQVALDGSRLGERLVLLAGDLPEAAVRRFAGGPLRGQVEWVAE